MFSLRKVLQKPGKVVYSDVAARLSENIFQATAEAWKKAELKCRPLWQELNDAADVPSCQPLRPFHEKYPFVSRILTTPEAIPGCLATLCRPEEPLESITENLDAFASVLLCAGRLGQLNSTLEIKRKQVALTNAAVMLYLSQRFHCYVGRKPNESPTSDTLGRNESKISRNNSRSCVIGKPSVSYPVRDQTNAIVLVGDLFITELYSWLSKLNDNYVAGIMSDNLAHFSQESFIDFSGPPTWVGGCLGDPFPTEGAMKMLLTTVLKSSAALAKATEQVQEDMADLGETLGGLYHAHVSLLNVLKSYCKMRTAEDEMNMLDLACAKETIRNFLKAAEVYSDRSRILISRYDKEPIASIATEALVEFLACPWLKFGIIKNI